MFWDPAEEILASLDNLLETIFNPQLHLRRWTQNWNFILWFSIMINKSVQLMAKNAIYHDYMNLFVQNWEEPKRVQFCLISTVPFKDNVIKQSPFTSELFLQLKLLSYFLTLFRIIRWLFLKMEPITLKIWFVYKQIKTILISRHV